MPDEGFTPDPIGDGFTPDAPVVKPPVPGNVRMLRNMVDGATFGTLKKGAAAIDATVAPISVPDSVKGSEQQGWSDRFKHAAQFYNQEYADAAQKPGSTTVKLASGFAMPMGVTSKLSQLAKAAGYGKLVRAGIGVGENAATNAVTGAINKSDTDALKGAEEGGSSLWNLLGASGPAAEGMGKLLRKFASKRAMRSMAPDAQGVNNVYETFGSREEAANWLRDTKLPDGTPLIAPRDSLNPTFLHNKIKMLQDYYGNALQQFRDLGDKIGAKVDVDALMQKIKGIYQDMKASPGIHVTEPNLPDQLQGHVVRLMDEAGYRGGPTLSPTRRLVSFSDWEKMKSSLGDFVRDTAAKYPRSEHAIEHSPMLKALDEIRANIKTADEAALGHAWGPDLVEHFVNTKDQYARASAFEPIARATANKAWTGNSENLAHTILQGRRLLPLLGASGAYAYSHSPVMAGVAAGVGAGAGALHQANPLMTRIYDAAGKGAYKWEPSPQLSANIRHVLGDD